MKARFTTVERLSTGRHFLAFKADPPSSCLLSPTSVLVLQLLAQAQDENVAREKFLALSGDKFTEPAETFEQQSSALLQMGLIEK
jgi:hypothetical protein